MPQIADRVQETTTTTGTGTLTLAGAVAGYRSFNSSFTNGDIVYYTIDDGSGNWEIGYGTVGTGTLSRTAVLESSNSNSLVSFGAGSKRVFCSAPTKVMLPNQTGNSGKILTTDGTTAAWQNPAAANSISQGNSNVTVTDTGTDGHVTITTEGSERLRVTEDGSVGIGTTTPNAKVEIVDAGSVALDAALLRITADDNAPYTLALRNSTYNTTGVIGKDFKIYTENSGVTWIAPPDYLDTGLYGYNLGVGTSSIANYSGYCTLTLGGATWGDACIDFNYANGAYGAEIYVSKGISDDAVYFVGQTSTRENFFSLEADTSIGVSLLNYLNKPTVFSTNSVERVNIPAAGGLLLRQSSNAANTSVSFDTTVQNALTLDSSGNLLITASGGLGYGTGSGGAVTQGTSRTTGVTLNKTNGAITLFSAAGTTTWQSFTVTNSTVAATDTIIVNQKSGTDLNEIHITAVAAGSFRISFRTTGGTTTEQPVFTFAVIKAVTA